MREVGCLKGTSRGERSRIGVSPRRVAAQQFRAKFPHDVSPLRSEADLFSFLGFAALTHGYCCLGSTLQGASELQDQQPGGLADICRGYRPRIVRPTIHAPWQGCGNRSLRAGFPAPHPGCISSSRVIRGCYPRLISVQPSGLRISGTAQRACRLSKSRRRLYRGAVKDEFPLAPGLPMHLLTERGLNEAFLDVVERHRREGLGVVVRREGRVVRCPSNNSAPKSPPRAIASRNSTRKLPGTATHFPSTKRRDRICLQDSPSMSD